MTLTQPSQPLCTCTEPTPSAGQDPTLPRACRPPGNSAGPICFTPGNSIWSSCHHFFLCKIETVCGTCKLHSLQKRSPPPAYCLKHLYKFYLNRKLEILFTICFSPKRASKINSQTLQEDINLTSIFFFFKKKRKLLSYPSPILQINMALNRSRFGKGPL